jgi:hypothetical protein
MVSMIEMWVQFQAGQDTFSFGQPDDILHSPSLFSKHILLVLPRTDAVINKLNILHIVLELKGDAVAQWLRHCATNLKVACSISSGFGALRVCMLASGTQDRGFAPDRSRRIFPCWKNPQHAVRYDTNDNWKCNTRIMKHNERTVRRADNIATFMCRLSWNLGASTSCNPQSLSRPVMGLLYLY